MREPSEAQSVSCDVSRVRASDRTESFGERRQLDGRARANFGSPARQGARWAWAGGAKGEARAVGPARGRPPGSPTRRGGPHAFGRAGLRRATLLAGVPRGAASRLRPSMDPAPAQGVRARERPSPLTERSKVPNRAHLASWRIRGALGANRSTRRTVAACHATVRP
jgi:hypothetical protein